ncbi:MAG: ABC transporter permease subunit [Alphaproteobacteria bacterium]|nr:ABC transporter permease subunit [Alphaproteobacteria bacterium]
MNYSRKVSPLRQAIYTYARLILLFAGFLLFLVPFIANDKPLILKWKNSYYFPILFHYSDDDFGGNFIGPCDYRSDEFHKRLTDNDWAVWAPIPYGVDFVDENLILTPAPPSAQHWLGTDYGGRDIFTLLLYALRSDFFIALSISLLAATIGGIIGCAQGYAGGAVDIVGQRFFEVWASIPDVIIILLLLEANSCSLLSFIMWVGFFHSLRYASVARMHVLRARHYGYVLAARVMGLGSLHIFRKHIVPTVFPFIAAQIPFQAASALSFLSAITFLYGPITTEPSLGSLIHEGRRHLYASWILWPPLVLLIIFIVCIAFVADMQQRTSSEEWNNA